jgi:hypothetical protein
MQCSFNITEEQVPKRTSAHTIILDENVSKLPLFFSSLPLTRCSTATSKKLNCTYIGVYRNETTGQRRWTDKRILMEGDVSGKK